MTASMWRMNGLCRRMAGVLVLCTLLLSSGVMCQDDADADPTIAPPADASTGAADAGDVSGTTVALSVPATGLGGDPGASAAPEDSSSVVTNSQAVGTSVITATPPAAVVVRVVVPDVECVGEKHSPESHPVKAQVTSSDCETTKSIIQANPAPWCQKENCKLEIFQDGNEVSVASSDADRNSLVGTLQTLKDKLGLKIEDPPSSPNSSVFVGILVTGLLAAIGLTVGYFKCKRRPDTKGEKLAEEAYPVDQENQGNTLVSVAPLNPPPETPEKPNVNGESPEAAKTQPPPPTNGHSTAKTADTEL